MSEHTPGPWVASSPGADYIVKASDGRTFCVGDAIYHPENAANARLIAAAPELLLLALGIVADCPLCSEGENCHAPRHDEARAAIAKAEGK